MLRELLTLLQEEGSLPVEELARRLGGTPDLVRAMLAHLERMGQVRLQGGMACGLGDACAGCKLRGWCGASRAPTLWQVTLPERKGSGA